MSRNFELLAQIERESGRADRLTRIAATQSMTKTAAAKPNGDVFGEEMLRLVQSIFLSGDHDYPRHVVFCSVDGESGSSSVCAGAGRALAVSSSQSVCMVDANHRSLRLSENLGIDKAIPFSVPATSTRGQCVEIAENLWLAGPNTLADNSPVLLPMEELKERLAELRKLFDFVLIDAPGTNVSGDAQVLGQVADAAVLVIEANRTRKLAARKAKETLERAGVRLLGTVLYNRTFPIPDKLYRNL
jgi:polysaccharide biosynthesis transport protein